MPSRVGRRRTSPEDRLDLVFHALADRTRRALLARLAKEGPAMVSTLAQPFAMTRPAVSKHLAILVRAHLVERAIDGRVRRCSLSPAPLHAIEEWLEGYRAFWTGTLEELARYAEGRAEDGGSDGG